MAQRRDQRLITGVALVLVLIVCGWFALGIRQARDTDRATELLSGNGRLSATQAADIASLLHEAKQLNPDAQVDILRAQLAYDRGQLAQAQQILGDVVRREPMNVVAWLWKGRSAANAHEFRLALDHIGQLMPKVPSAP